MVFAEYYRAFLLDHKLKRLPRMKAALATTPRLARAATGRLPVNETSHSFGACPWLLFVHAHTLLRPRRVPNDMTSPAHDEVLMCEMKREDQIPLLCQ